MENWKYAKFFLKRNSGVFDLKKIRIVLFFSIISVLINALLPLITERIVDDGLMEKKIQIVMIWSVIFSLIFGLQLLIDYLREKQRIIVYLEIKKDISRKLVDKLLRVKYQYFYNKNLLTKIKHEFQIYFLNN